MICATVSGMFSGTVYTIIRVLGRWLCELCLQYLHVTSMHDIVLIAGTTSKMPWTHVAFVQVSILLRLRLVSCALDCVIISSLYRVWCRSYWLRPLCI